MNTYEYNIRTTSGEASGSLLAKSEATARAKLAKHYAGELWDDDGNPLNNDVESIRLEEVV